MLLIILFFLVHFVKSNDISNIHLDISVLDKNASESASEIICWINYNIEKTFLKNEFFIDSNHYTRKILNFQIAKSFQYPNLDFYRVYTHNFGQLLDTYSETNCNSKIEYLYRDNNYFCNKLENCSYYVNNSQQFSNIQNLSKKVYRFETLITYNNIHGNLFLDYHYKTNEDLVNNRFYAANILIKLNNIDYSNKLSDLIYASIWAQKLDCIEFDYVEIIVVSGILGIIFIVLFLFIIYPHICKNKKYCGDSKITVEN